MIENLHVEIQPFFSTEELNQLARETKFVQREGKIDGEIFFDLLVFHNENLKKQSLNDLTIILDVNYQIDYQRQSLHERFNENAVKFLFKALEKLLQRQLKSSSIKILGSKFKRVIIKDSVCFQIDESLALYYPGSGGAGSDAAIRIQFEFDLLSGTVTDLSVNAFNDQDASNSLVTIEKVESGDLVLRDLAYMSIAVLKRIIKKIAFYLCRPNAGVKMYELKDGEYVELNYVDIVKYMKKYNLSIMEKDIYYGKKEKLKTRLILHLLPADELEKRLRKANQNAKKKGRKAVTKEYKAKAALNLFITNAKAEQIPTEKVWPIYSLRWQIELMFKVWKSICNIEKVKKVNKERLECYVYSKLIFIMLGWKITWIVAKKMFLFKNKALSFYKAFKTLLNKKRDAFYNALKSSDANMISFIVNFYELSIAKHVLEKRLQEQTSIEIIIDCLKGKELNFK